MTHQDRFYIGGARSEVPEARAQEGARGLTRDKRIPQDRQGGQGGHAHQVTAFFTNQKIINHKQKLVLVTSTAVQYNAE